MDNLAGKPSYDVHSDIISLAPASASIAASAWVYQRTGNNVLVELGSLSGDAAPGLGMHFHDEVQIVFVLAGARFFLMRSTMVVVRAGQCLCIPAGLPHRPLAIPSPGTRCLNAYVSVDGLDAIPMVIDIEHEWMQMEEIPLIEVIRSFRNHERLIRGDIGIEHRAACRLRQYVNNTDRVCDLARRNGYTREGFSRQFAREVGIPPHAYRIIERLNHARRLLRAGEPIAIVAAQTGFADQSHLGRLFRRTFGTTPGAYAKT